MSEHHDNSPESLRFAISVLQDRLDKMDATPPAHAGEELAAFKESHSQLDLLMTKDAWGRDCFYHPHVQSLWEGWKARSGLTPSASAPVEVTKEMVERAIHELDFTAPESREHMRRALTAALKGKS